MRIGVFGGSFDPVHYGHLWIAMHAWEQLRLDELRIVPAAQSPLKARGVHAAAEQRLEMLRLAVGGTPQLTVDDSELTRGGISYTLLTLQNLRQQWPTAELLLVIGADSLASFAQWHQPAEILQLATLAVVQRGGSAAPADYGVLEPFADASKVQACIAAEIVMPQIEVSSTELRQRIALERSIRFRTPRAVEAYIEAHGLYRQGADSVPAGIDA